MGFGLPFCCTGTLISVSQAVSLGNRQAGQRCRDTDEETQVWQACSLIVRDTDTAGREWRQGELWLVTVGQDWRENGTMVGDLAGKRPGGELAWSCPWSLLGSLCLLPGSRLPLAAQSLKSPTSYLTSYLPSCSLFPPRPDRICLLPPQPPPATHLRPLPLCLLPTVSLASVLALLLQGRVQSRGLGPCPLSATCSAS